MAVFFKIIFIALLIYYLIRGIGRFLLRGFINNVNGQMRQQENVSGRNRKKEGNVTVDYKPYKDKNIGKDEGDYVDFEEIK
jgi:hypothetical protein